MKFIAKLLFSFLANGLALWVAAHAVQGFSIVATLRAYTVVTVIFTLIELIVRPILKLFFTPLIIMTLGLGLIVVDAIALELMAHLAGSYVLITGLYPLVYATLIIGVVHIVLSLSSKYIYSE